MENQRRTRTLRLIFKIFQFINRIYDDYVKGDYTETNPYEEVSLPVALKTVIKRDFLQVMVENIVSNVEGITPSPESSKIIRDMYLQYYERFKNVMSDSTFISWTNLCCISAKKFKDGGFSEAPVIAATVVNEMCESSMKYSAFTRLGCDI